jgi:hypothetical protein
MVLNGLANRFEKLNDEPLMDEEKTITWNFVCDGNDVVVKVNRLLEEKASQVYDLLQTMGMSEVIKDEESEYGSKLNDILEGTEFKGLLDDESEDNIFPFEDVHLHETHTHSRYFVEEDHH